MIEEARFKVLPLVAGVATGGCNRKRAREVLPLVAGVAERFPKLAFGKDTAVFFEMVEEFFEMVVIPKVSGGGFSFPGFEARDGCLILASARPLRAPFDRLCRSAPFVDADVVAGADALADEVTYEGGGGGVKTDAGDGVEKAVKVGSILMMVVVVVSDVDAIAQQSMASPLSLARECLLTGYANGNKAIFFWSIHGISSRGGRAS